MFWVKRYEYLHLFKKKKYLFPKKFHSVGRQNIKEHNVGEEKKNEKKEMERRTKERILI